MRSVSTNNKKWFTGELQIPVGMLMPYQQDTSQKVLGLIPYAAKDFFSSEIYV